MRRRFALAAVLVLAPLTAWGQGPAPCASGGADPLPCPTYARHVNRRFAFSVDVPAFFVKKPADADGRGQTFEWGRPGAAARVRAWAMYDNPPMTLEQLYADWTRRNGITFKAIAGNTWIVRGKEGGQSFYSRSILADAIISTIEVRFDPAIADAMEPILARVGPSLMVLAGEGPRAAR